MVTTKVWEASQIYGFEKLYWKNLKEIKICVLNHLTFDYQKEQEKNLIGSLKHIFDVFYALHWIYNMYPDDFHNQEKC